MTIWTFLHYLPPYSIAYLKRNCKDYAIKVITGANVLVFGPCFGLLISWIGEVIGALITLYLYRLGLKDKSGQLSDRYKLLKILTEASGKKAGGIVFYSRLMPFVPSGLVTLAA